MDNHICTYAHINVNLDSCHARINGECLCDEAQSNLVAGVLGHCFQIKKSVGNKVAVDALRQQGATVCSLLRLCNPGAGAWHCLKSDCWAKCRGDIFTILDKATYLASADRLKVIAALLSQVSCHA